MSVACKIFDPQELDWGRQARIVNPQRLILKEELRMKKVLSLVLAFAMILGSFGFVFASDFPDVSDTEYFSEPVNVLSGFGVIGGFPDGTFGPEKEVTRAQMATMIVNALGMTVNGQSDTKFSDVPKSHWASGFIAYATSVGFVAGYPDGTFKPDASVTYDQALTMIVAALGYSAESLPGTWPGSFVNKAQGLGILDICKTTGTTNAPRQDIACFLYKALTQPIGYTDKDGAFNANRGADGVVGSDTMLARLGATPFNGGKAFVYDGSQPSAINIKSYLGAFISAYQNKDGEIVAIKEVLSEFVEGEYKTGNKTVDGKKFDTATNLPAAAATDDYTGAYVGFLNGEVNTATVSNVAAGGALGNVKVAVKLTGSKVTTVYSVQVWNPDDVFMADKDIQETIADDQALAGYKFVLDSEDEIDVNEFELVGRDALADIAEDDVLTIYANTKSEITKIEVGTEKVEGKITKISSTGACTIGGTEYDVDPEAVVDATGAAALKVKDEGTFYLTYAGDIYEFKATEDTTSNYAVLLAVGKQAGKYAGSDAFFVDLFLADGTEKEFEVKDEAVLTAATAGLGLTSPVAAKDMGYLVEYTVNSSNVVTAIVGKALPTTPVAEKFDKNGVTTVTTPSLKLASDTVVFEFTGAAADIAKADYYKVVKVDALMNQGVVNYVGMDDTKGALTASLITGLSGSSASYAIFIDYEAESTDGFLFSALYEGEVKDITADTKYTVSYITTSPVAITFYKLSFDADGVVNKTPAVDTTPAVVATLPVSTVATTMSGNVLTVSGTNYSFDKDAEVYCYDVSDDKWTAKTLADLGAKKGAYTSIVLIDTDADTTYYEMAIIIKP